MFGCRSANAKACSCSSARGAKGSGVSPGGRRALRAKADFCEATRCRRELKTGRESAWLPAHAPRHACLAGSHLWGPGLPRHAASEYAKNDVAKRSYFLSYEMRRLLFFQKPTKQPPKG